jgi:hypothetical protein
MDAIAHAWQRGRRATEAEAASLRRALDAYPELGQVSLSKDVRSVAPSAGSAHELVAVIVATRARRLKASPLLELR